jgi:transposase
VLISKLPAAGTIVADKGYDGERIRKQVALQGAEAMIPRKRNSAKGNADLDRGLYRNRRLVENAFARLKYYAELWHRDSTSSREITKAWWPWPVPSYGYPCRMAILHMSI